MIHGEKDLWNHILSYPVTIMQIELETDMLLHILLSKTQNDKK